MYGDGGVGLLLCCFGEGGMLLRYGWGLILWCGELEIGFGGRSFDNGGGWSDLRLERGGGLLCSVGGFLFMCCGGELCWLFGCGGG